MFYTVYILFIITRVRIQIMNTDRYWFINSVFLSVRPSVLYTPVFCQNG